MTKDTPQGKKKGYKAIVGYECNMTDEKAKDGEVRGKGARKKAGKRRFKESVAKRRYVRSSSSRPGRQMVEVTRSRGRLTSEDLLAAPIHQSATHVRDKISALTRSYLSPNDATVAA